jgi:uncharacterized membrane protein
MSPLTNVVLVTFALAAVVLAALWLERNVRFIAKIGASATTILLALFLSNIGLLPGDSSVYDFLLGRAVIAGIVLILLNVRLSSIREAGGTMLAAFAVGAVGSAAGAVVMGFVVNRTLGADTWKLGGQFTATYIGGGMNYAAVGQELATRADLFSAGIAADVIVTAIWLVACLVVPELFPQTSRANDVAASSADSPTTPGSTSLAAQLQSSGVALTLTDFAGLATVTLGTIWASEALAALFPAAPKIIWLTTLVLILAQLPIIRRLSGGVVIGNFLVLLFLASNGAKSVVSRIVDVGPAIFYFAAGTVLIHGIIIFGIGRMLRMNGDLLSIASQANVGGSTTAMALAGARRRPDLILPGVAVGMLGNAIGNYAGIGIAYLSRSLFA